MIETLLFASIWYGHYIHYIKLSFYHRGNYAEIGSYTLILFLITKLYDGFKLGYLRLMDVLYSQILALLCSNVLMYIQLCIISRDYMNPMKLVGMTVVELVLIVAWVLLWSWVYTKIYPPRQMLLVYGGRPPKNLVEKLHSRKDKYQICEMISAQKGADIVCRRIDRYENVVLCEMPLEIQSSIVEYCFQHSIRSYIVPKITDIMLLGAEQIHLFDTPILLLRNQGLGVEQMIVKRFMDLVISFLMLILTSPLMLLIAFCIKVQDGGPVIYKQKRLTKDGREFDIYKFRSMVVGAEQEGEAVLAKENDERITPVGRFIRRTRLDELPQLYHVITGEMSLVGPRPPLPREVARYTRYERRLSVTPGLTCYWQVRPDRYELSMNEWVELDLMYIQNRCLRLDWQLILQTVGAMVQGSGQ